MKWTSSDIDLVSNSAIPQAVNFQLKNEPIYLDKMFWHFQIHKDRKAVFSHLIFSEHSKNQNFSPFQLKNIAFDQQLLSSSI